MIPGVLHFFRRFSRTIELLFCLFIFFSESLFDTRMILHWDGHEISVLSSSDLVL
jgi:hypothetical protein